MRKHIICSSLILALLLSGCSARGEIRAPERPSASPLPPVAIKAKPDAFNAVPVYLDGILFARAYEAWGSLYVPLGPLCEKAGAVSDWQGDEDSFWLDLGGLRVEGKRGQKYFTASGRYIYAPEDWLIHGGELYLPVGALCKLLNISAEQKNAALYLDGRRLCVLESGADYYDLHFKYEDVFWLSHIIGSEAGIEPLEGKIAVGNVVMNRVKDPDFPDTVFGVVYDYEHTIQFEPVSKGTIHQDPREEDIIAAYLVLEGVNTAGDCLYFVNPDFGSFWFDNNLELVMKIGRHNFYVSRSTEDAGATA
jgi:Cell wall hydrolyses involved in spore germination